MERQGDEVHLTTTEARGGTGPRSMRLVLGISMALAIAVLSALWITAAILTPGAPASSADSAAHAGVEPVQGQAP